MSESGLDAGVSVSYGCGICQIDSAQNLEAWTQESSRVW